jgi:hypothetical protein
MVCNDFYEFRSCNGASFCVPTGTNNSYEVCVTDVIDYLVNSCGWDISTGGSSCTGELNCAIRIIVNSCPGCDPC